MAALRVLRDYQMRLRLRNEVDRYPSDNAAAKAFGVSRGHLSRVLRGLKPVDGNAESARLYLETRLWPNGPTCPVCSSG